MVEERLAEQNICVEISLTKIDTSSCNNVKETWKSRKLIRP